MKKLILLIFSICLLTSCNQNRARNQVINHFKVKPENVIAIPRSNDEFIVRGTDGTIYYVVNDGFVQVSDYKIVNDNITVIFSGTNN